MTFTNLYKEYTSPYKNMSFYKEIQNYMVKSLHKNHNYNLVGGMMEDKSYTYKKYVFRISKNTDEDTYIRIHNTNQCFIVIIYSDNTSTAILQSFSNIPQCSTPKLPNDGGGTIMMKFLLHYLKNIQKCKTVELTDLSNIPCKNDDTIELANLYTLTTGITWYGKFGFVPNEKYIYDKFKNNMKIMGSIKTKDVVKIKYEDGTIGDLLEDNNITIHYNTLLKNSLKQLFIKDCSHYHKISHVLFYKLKIKSMYGKTFTLKLFNQK